MKRFQVYIILLITCNLLFPACEKEEVDEGTDFIDEPPPIENSSNDITELITPQETSVTFPYAIDDTVRLQDVVYHKDLRLYPLTGTGEVTLRHSIYPFYAFEDNTSNGDYYLVKSEVSVVNEGMYKDNKIYRYDKEMSDGGGDEQIYTGICGYYLRAIRLKYQLCDTKHYGVVGEYPVGHSPTPLTTIGSTTYISGFSFTIGGQIRIGNDTLSINPLLFDFEYNQQTIRNIQDMDIRNTSTSQIANYEFSLNNLPSVGHEFDLSPLLPAPPLSVNTGTYLQEFIWRVPSTKDFQGDDVRFALLQTVELEYGYCHSRWTFPRKIQAYTYKLRENVKTVSYSNIVDITPPCRIPMGKLKLPNRNKGLYVTKVTVTEEGGKEPLTISKGSLAYGKSFEIYVNTGKYKVEFMMGKNSRDAKKYTLIYDAAEVAKDETLELFSDYDFMTSQ